MKPWRALALALACAFAHAASPSSVAPVDAYPDIAAAYWVEIDGRPLWAGHADERLPMASLAKLMTALVAVEAGELDAWVDVSTGAAAETGTRIGLLRGERVKRSDLLAATLVRSANDACRALADGVGASIDPRRPTAAFVARMNARAATLGLSNTHYANPCGHDDDAQYTSARDLAALSHAVLADATLVGIAQRRDVAFKTSTGRTLSAHTTNALLDGLPGARGLKTGTTPAAGRCLVAVVERDGRRVLAVLLHAPERWWDSVGLVELAFETPRAPAGSIEAARPDASGHR